MVVVITPTDTGFPNAIQEGLTMIPFPVTRLKTIQRIRKYPHYIRNVSGVTAGVLIFALFIHDPWPIRLLSFAALTGSALLLGYSIRNKR